MSQKEREREGIKENQPRLGVDVFFEFMIYPTAGAGYIDEFSSTKRRQHPFRPSGLSLSKKDVAPYKRCVQRDMIKPRNAP